MAETKVELNTGFETSQSGISKASKVALNTSTPAALANDSGVLKRKVLEPDEFPKADMSNAFPSIEEYPNRGMKPMSDGKSKTA